MSYKLSSSYDGTVSDYTLKFADLTSNVNTGLSNLQSFYNNINVISTSNAATLANLQSSNLFEIKAPLQLSGGINNSAATSTFDIKGTPAKGTVIYNGMAIGIGGGLKIGANANTPAAAGSFFIENDDGTQSFLNNMSDNQIDGRSTKIQSSDNISIKAPITKIYGDIQWCDKSGTKCTGVLNNTPYL
jgi:hypothetical protein